jgi:hypothetical protein
VNKPNTLSTLESVQPFSGHYSCKKDIRLNAWFLVAAAVYITDQVLEKHHPEWSVPVRAGLALAPLFPGLLYIRSCMRFVSGLDELQRRIQLEAWLYATMGTVLTGIALSTLSSSGVRLGELDHGLGIGRAFMLVFAMWVIATALASRRYK